jgi:hypothetical protein
MKKNLLALSLALLVALGVNAQADVMRSNAKPFHGPKEGKITLNSHQVKGPLAENFEGTFPPVGWSLTAGTGDWAQFADVNHTTGGTNSAIYDCYNIDGTVPAYLQTPEMAVTSGDNTFTFWCDYYLVSGAFGNASSLFVDISSDNGSTWTNGTTDYLVGITLDAWTLFTIDLTANVGQNVVLRFKAISDYGSYNIAIDDVTGPSLVLPAHDLGAVAVTPSGFVLSGSTVAPHVFVTNFGSTDEATYSVQLTDGAGYDQTINSTSTLVSLGNADITFPSWTPADGNFTLTATVTLAGDLNPGNDVATSPVDVRAYQFGDVVSQFTTQTGSAVGIETDGTNIYVQHFNSAVFDRYTMNGTFVNTFSIAAAANIRDLAYDGTNFYGAPNTTSVFKLSFTPGSEALVSTITAPQACRALAFDGDDNTFWGNSGTGIMKEFGMTGVLTGRTFTPSVGIYGAAYDNFSDPANPTIWGTDWSGGKARIVEWALNGVATGRTVDLTSYIGGTLDAGGLAIYKEGATAYLLADFQSNPNTVVKIFLATVAGADITFDVTAGANPVSGANVNVNGMDYSTSAAGSVTVTLAPGTYAYTVSKAGYQNGIGNVTVVDGVNQTIPVALAAIPQDFEGIFPPNGWSLTAGGGNWAKLPDVNHTSGGANSAIYACYDIVGTDPAYLQTYEMSVTAGDATFAFWCNYYLISGTWGSASNLFVDISTNGGAAWTSGTTDYLSGIALDSWVPFTIDLSAYIGQNVVLRFKGISDYGSYNIAIDDVLGPARYLPAHDLGITGITPSGFIASGSTVAPQVTVANLGGDEATYTVQLTNGAGYDHTISSSAILPSLGTINITFPSWTPADGSYTLTSTVTVAGDVNAANDIKVAALTVGTFEDAYAGNTTALTYNKFDLASGVQTAVGTIGSAPFPMAEEFNGISIYRIYSDLTIGTVGADGVYSNLGTMTGVAGTPTGIAYNWNTGVWYVMVLDGASLPQLCTLNMNTLALTLIGTGAEGMIIAMDFAWDGFLYGPSLNPDNLYKIDPATGVTTSIGPIGIDLNYGQDVSFDGQTGKLYGCTVGAAAKFGTYDLTTGAFAEISDNGTDQIATFVITKVPLTAYNVNFTINDGTNPIAGAQIAINGSTLTSNATGNATFTYIAGTYNYTVSKFGYFDATGTVTIAGANQNVTVTMTSSSSYAVTFTVTDNVPAALAGAAIVVTQGANTFNGTTNASGVYVFAALPAATYNYTVTLAGYMPVSASFIVAAANVAVNVILPEEMMLPYGLAVADGADAVFTWNNAPSTVSVLAVDHDASNAVTYTDDWAVLQPALDASTLINYTYFEADAVTFNGPDLATMQNYDVVLWFTGEAWHLGQTMTAADKVNIKAYVQGGGKFILSGQDYLYDQNASGATYAAGSFEYDVLGITSVSQDAISIASPDLGTGKGVTGSYLDGTTFSVADIYTTAKEGLYIDDLTGTTAGTSGLMEMITPLTGLGAVSTANTVFSTIPLAAITEQAKITSIINAMVSDLTGTSVESPEGFVGYNVYLDNLTTPVATNVTATTYTFVAPSVGIHTAGVSSVYTTGQSAIVTLLWGHTGTNVIPNANVTIYPNPTKGRINIENVSNANIYITNVLGTVIASKENVSGSTGFDLSNVANGIYLVKIVSGNKVITKKINVID